MIKILESSMDNGSLRLLIARGDNRSEVVRITLPTGQTEIIREEFTGRMLTQSGKWVVPVVEVDGAFQPRPEDPKDPYARVSVSDALAVHIATVLASIDNSVSETAEKAMAGILSSRPGRALPITASSMVANLSRMGVISK